ncbi:MAG TPA: hypothetical protein VLK53_03955 [Gaiellaceae bacterium]|nr:hypothetical protein [Gaiellaceae bacterium]
MNWRRWLEWGGYAAGAVLIAFGIAVIALALNGRSTVHSSLKDEKITGTPDMTPAAIKEEAAQSGLEDVSLPSCSVAGKVINNGDRARCFASYMRIHALEATGGLVYADMPRFATADGKGTNDATKASKGPGGRPLDNPARQVWITETALSTALNVSYMADQLALFSLVVGIALLLTGVGFIILAAGGALRRTTAAAAPRPEAAPAS